MRLGLVLEPAEPDPLGSLSTQAIAAEEAGLALAWIADAEGTQPALTSAAALAARTSSLRLGACVPAAAHPLAIAEDATVADNCSNGRLVLVLEDRRGDAERLGETADVLLAAFAPRPFRHDGERWTIPGGLAENDGREERIAVTPPPVQLELPMWLAGPAAAVVARKRGLSHVAGTDDGERAAGVAWRVTSAALGLAVTRLRRPALRAVEATAAGDFDDDALVGRLRLEQRAWGLDVAIVALPPGLGDGARTRAIRRLASRVLPRVTMDALPPGLEAEWRSRLPA